MSTTNVAKFVNLHDYQEQSEEKHKSWHSVAEADNNRLVPSNSTNSIDHTAKHDSPVHPSTSGEVYDRRQMLRSIYAAKRSIPATSRKCCLATSSRLDQGRTSQGELIDNLREELYGIKRNYAATLKENVVLKTRLKRSNNEIAKKDRQLQNLMFSESKGYVSDDRRKNMLSMKQKVAMPESVLEEKTKEISRLKYDRATTRISDYQEHITGLQKECKHCHTKIRADVRNLPKGQSAVGENNNARKLKEAVSLLEKENDMLRSKLQILFNCSNCSSNELSTFEREELIALIIHLKSELKKKERWENCNAKSERPMQEHTSLIYGQKLLPVKQKSGKPINRLKTNKKVAALDNESQKQLRTEIKKIHSDDEQQRMTVSTGKIESPKVATQIKGSRPNANDDSYTSISHKVAIDTKLENVAERLGHPFSRTKSVSGKAREESEVAEQRQEVMNTQRAHASEIAQRKWGKYKDSENRADEHLAVHISAERSTSEDNRDNRNQIFDDAANNQFIKRNSNYSSEVEKGNEEEGQGPSSNEELRRIVPAKKFETDETKVENAERLELKKDEVMPNFVFRSILRITSAHLKRLELLVAKTNSYS